MTINADPRSVRLEARPQKVKHECETFDVVILGAGAAGLAAASVAACEGLRVLVIEKTSTIGGTSAISGGACWMPLSRHSIALGANDSARSVTEYVKQFTGDSLDAKIFQQFLERSPEAVDYFESRTSLRFTARPLSPDYRPQLPGASLFGRVLDPAEFDGRILGDSLRLLRPPMPEYTAFNGMMVNKADAAALLGAFSSFKKFRRSCALVGRFVVDRIRYGRGTRLLLGSALVAALLKSALDAGVVVRVEAIPTKLTTDDNKRVTGVEYDWHGAHQTVRAVYGVIIATGGFPGDEQRKSTRVPFAKIHFSVPPPTNDGGGLRLAEALGGEVSKGNVSAFYFSPVSLTTRADGSEVIFPHLVLDRQKPGLIAVNQKGLRFANEADSYHDFVTALQRAHELDNASIPAFLICDQKFLRKYGLGVVHPGGLGIRRRLRAGYLIRADSVANLSAKIGVDPIALADTIARNNQSASTGEDKEFGRGSNAYHRFFGDPENKPNPCIGTIEVAPFYAVRIWPGDIGSAEGLAVTENAQVIGQSGKPIDGLYAVGNDMNSVFRGTYPGPGITLGPALTFGYVAAKALRATHDGRTASTSAQKSRRRRVVAT